MKEYKWECNKCEDDSPCVVSFKTDLPIKYKPEVCPFDDLMECEFELQECAK